MQDGSEPLNIRERELFEHCVSLNAPFIIKLHSLEELEVQMLFGISPVIQLLDRTRDDKLHKVNTESGIDPYNFMLLKMIFCSLLDVFEETRDVKFPISLLLERLIS